MLYKLSCGGLGFKEKAKTLFSSTIEDMANANVSRSLEKLNLQAGSLESPLIE